MDFGAYVLPGLAITILVTLGFVTAAWVFDGVKAEEDVELLDDAPSRREKQKQLKRRGR